MVIPRSYPRAAGLQSEIKKETVTRIAGMEVTLRHQVDVYNKNLAITVNNINKEQLFLRRSMTNLNNKKMQIRKDRDKLKHRKEFLAVQPNRGVQNKLVRVKRLDQPGDDDTSSTTETFRESIPSAESRKKSGTQKRKDGKRTKFIIEADLDVDSESGSETCDSISDDVGRRYHVGKGPVSARSVTFCQNLPDINEEKTIEGDRNDDKTALLRPNLTGYLRTGIVKSSTAPEIVLPRSGRKPKTKSAQQSISFGDLIKMQHSPDTKQLFGLVNKLAKNQGVDLGITTRSNVVDPRSKNVQNKSHYRTAYAKQLQRRVSVLYSIQNGYGDTEGDEEAVHTVFPKASNELPSAPDRETEISDEFNFPMIVSGEKVKSGFVTKQVQSSNERIPLPSIKPDKLPPDKQQLQKRKSTTKDFKHRTAISNRLQRDKFQQDDISALTETRSPYTKTSNREAITWETAMGLLKTVHTIE